MNLVDFKKDIKGRVLFNEPLSRHTSFGIGGPAKLFIMPLDKEDLKKILLLSCRYSIPYYILGNGSNLLIRDKGINGIVIKLDGSFNHFDFEKNRLIAGGGVGLSILRKEASKRGLSGLEFTTGIPGTLGGAIAMNAGIDNANIGGLVKGIEIMERSGRTRWVFYKEIDFGYRSTSIEKGSVILKADLKLKKSSPISIRKKIHSVWIKRKKTQPIREKSAGSIFKNPKSPIPAGERAAGQVKGAGFIIEKAGLKGRSCGGACISSKHANFIINKGGAKAGDVLKLIKEAQRKVYNKFGINLELEIKIWN